MTNKSSSSENLQASLLIEDAQLPLALKEIPQSYQKPPIKLSFDNIEFEVDKTQRKWNKIGNSTTVTTQKILKGVSGYALPGETLYIMGSSGAGKTSLLNIISDRIQLRPGVRISGNVRLNDSSPLNSEVFGSLASYVMQDDILYAKFTPRQALRFAARLKLKSPQRDQDQKVEELLKELGLVHVANTLIGNEKKKTLSGGERKRVSIGVELISDPQIILLDEPTSGLDSFKALSIVKLLRNQARKGKTVISTIHSPGSDSFQLFDKLILMCDGHIVYQGRADQSEQYFKQIGMPVKTFTNPADEYMKYLTINYPKTNQDEHKIAFFNEQYRSQIIPKINQEEKQYTFQPIRIDPSHSQYQGVIKEFIILSQRNWVGIKRDKSTLISRFSQSLFLGLLSLALFYDLSESTLKKEYQLAGALYYLCMASITISFLANVTTFQEERTLFLKEQSTNMYRIITYYISKSIFEVPFIVILPTLTIMTTYFGIGTTVTVDKFFIAYLAYILLTANASSYAYFLSSLFNKSETAVQVAPMLLIPILLFSGFVSNIDSVPGWISWIQYISAVRYAFEIMIQNEFKERYLIGKYTMVDFFHFNLGITNCFILLLVLTIVVRVLAYLCLKILVRKIQ